MAIPTRSSQPGTFFVTSATYGRRRLFRVASNAELFDAALQEYRLAGNYKLYGFVVIPDHVHLLLTPQAVTLERCLGPIKGGFWHRLGSKVPVLQRGFTDHRIRNRAEFETRRKYIDQNPVRARMLERAELYAHSSAYRADGEAAYLSG